MTEASEFTAPPDTSLRVDLDAIGQNYAALSKAAPRAETAAVVKANAYGLGASAVARKLFALGCRTFFVATLGEGVELRSTLGRDVGAVWVLNGFDPAQVGVFEANQLGAVLNTREEVQAFLQAPTGPCALHIDTGMNRLGVPLGQASGLAESFAKSDTADLRLVMSHLACSEDARASMNIRQRQRFLEASQAFDGVPRSLANTGGVFLGPDWHFDLTRPGIGLFGASADPKAETGLAPAATLDAPILQVRDVHPGESVGYGASFVAETARRIAIAAAGYADGLPCALSGKGFGRIEGEKAPIAGRISMDLVALDVTDITDSAQPGSTVSFFGQDLDEMARLAGTLPYELLTGIGGRVPRRFKG